MAPSSDSFRELLNALQCGAGLVDLRGQILHANDALCRMFARPADRVVGRNLLDFYPDPQNVKVIHKVLDSDEPSEREFYIPQPDGARLPVAGASRPLDLPGQPPMRVFTLIDITRQKSAYRQVADLTDTVVQQALELKHHARELERRVEERTADLARANHHSILMLALASEAKDRDTGNHVRRIQHYTEALAIELGLADTEARHLGEAAILHDVGKLHVPDEILQKPGPLTDEQRAVMQQHTVAGQRILADTPFFAIARDIARSHHERWDGAGYPDRLTGESIPLAARIVHVADVFDALVSRRVYKDAWPLERAAEVIRGEAGTSFDPAAAEAFGRLFERGAIREIAVNHIGD
ncbi:MAG: HD-GYP domain-containing protein [Planctomycetota bacterium]|jgi:PAS domain S-box-containing protein/putative nucleotidyltransferase with HDIG domain